MRKAFAAFVFLVLVGIFSVPSCASQGEGERCDLNAAYNGSDDCNSGLVCTPPDQLRWPVTSDGGIAQRPQTPLCCPPTGTPATTDVCKNMTPNLGSDAAIPDGDVSETSSSETGAETSSDAPVDSPADTASDAPADATGQ